MTDYPIIFSAPMVRALLEGRKTQTRRLAWGKDHIHRRADPRDSVYRSPRSSPWQRVQPGDRLWVREAFAEAAVPGGTEYMADFRGDPTGLGWHPSIHMPRALSRITLTVMTVRFQRLQEISEEDARAEGIVRFRSGDTILYGIQVPGGYELVGLSARETFISLWCDLHGPSAWNDNPEIVALTFTIALRNIDAASP